MKRVNKGILMLACLLAVLMLLPAVVFAAGPIDVEKSSDFTLFYGDGDTPLPGAKFDVFKVADVLETGELVVTDTFKAYNVELDGFAPEDYQKLALRLKGEVQLAVSAGAMLPDLTLETGSDGYAKTALKPGLYLVIGNRLVLEQQAYVTDPFMSLLPLRDDENNDWIYSTTVMPKNTQPTALRKIIKIWDEENVDTWRDIESVSVDILCDGELKETVELTRENNWTYEWEDSIDPRLEHDWTVVEHEIPFFVPEYEVVGTTLTIKNLYNPPLEPNEIEIVKSIDGKPKEDSTFKFELTPVDPSNPMPEGSKDGKCELTIVGMNRNKFGDIHFEEPGTYIYKVVEVDTGEKGYTYDGTIYTLTFDVTRQGVGLSIDLVITNNDGEAVDAIKFVNNYEITLPQTGLLWWPVPVLLIAGLAMMILGFAVRRVDRDEN